MTDKKAPLSESKLLRGLLITAGFFSTAMAVVGIFVPLLPTVPLLLLAAACFARSSESFHQWLLEHPRLGPMIKDYLGGQGIPLRAKVTAISLIWISICISVLLLIPLFWVKVFLIAIGLCVTIYLLRLPVAEREDD
jgi:uncharacterized membrane protein YbaN (DUF454 family)